MENQHRKITGYRELSEEEIAAMNAIKELAAMAGRVVDGLRNGVLEGAFGSLNVEADQRWVSIGATDLQTGFMALTRAIAQPETF